MNRVAAEDERRAVELARPIVQELRANGVLVRSIGDFLEQGRDIRPAIPILLRWLPQTTDRGLKEGIVRALTDRRARPVAAKPLIKEYRALDATEDRSLRWVIGNALEAVADELVIEDLLQIVQDRNGGTARQMVVVALGRMKDPRVPAVLMKLVYDPDVIGHAVVALRKLAPPEARDTLLPLRTHENAWVRRTARQALERIDARVSSGDENSGT
jgi:HEAT repeat protein